jgi:CDP-diacylglycerol--glycerol-3-phosphate 3-phosphatidyltransferase
MAKPSSTDQKSEKPVVLTDKLRIYAKVIIDPIVSFLAKYRLSPDVLTVLGMLFHFLFAWLIATGQFRVASIAMLLLSPLDALDGSLARKLGRKQGGFGAFLDSTLDRIAEIILFGGFIYYYWQLGDVEVTVLSFLNWQVDSSTMMFVAYLAVTGSIMVSYARSKAESLGYDCKVGIASRVERYALMIILLYLNLPAILLWILAAASYFTLFQRGYTVWRQWLAEMKAEEEVEQTA